jgi:hypothetical protein
MPDPDLAPTKKMGAGLCAGAASTPMPMTPQMGPGLGAALHRSGTFLGTKKNLELRWGRGKFEVQVRYAKGVSRDLPTLNTTRSIEELSHPS